MRSDSRGSTLYATSDAADFSDAAVIAVVEAGIPGSGGKLVALPIPKAPLGTAPPG